MRCAELAACALLGLASLQGPVNAQTAAPAPTASLPIVPVAPATQPLPPNRWNAAQIRQAFDLADGDANGELTRQEVQRLAIVPRPFEDMDLNKDGVISRAEFEGAFGR
ncbi:EF-hand domain-containing protein [Caenimonas aquaedulcis]|uniref:EF-hand domain-containing protein n=1 Tax=Caenimonas aquaedulcis TaxID=2793270 RepID=A0A931H5M9_9BURK|nr:EF-hand domain-containing protein [Caenimonas aquaedulcis]MBG9389095.1 EF-hand domain-containing protein [Caenimonas aquaedulcis]